jgi:hypothetical protein
MNSVEASFFFNILCSAKFKPLIELSLLSFPQDDAVTFPHAHKNTPPSTSIIPTSVSEREKKQFS